MNDFFEVFARLVPYKYRIFILPAVTLIVVIVLSATVGRFMVDRIFSLRDELSSLSQKSKTLQAKDSLLSSFNKDELRTQAQGALAAIPSQTPSLPALSTLRSLAARRGVIISDFRVDEKNDPKVSAKTAEIQLSAFGGVTAIVGFLGDLQEYAPLMKVAEVEINSSGSTSIARLSVISIWAPLPKSLGRTDAALDQLKEPEKQILSRLMGLKAIGGGGGIVPSAPSGRTNPFEL